MGRDPRCACVYRGPASPLLPATRRHQQQGDWRQRCPSHACQPFAARPAPPAARIPAASAAGGLAPKVPVPCVSTFRGPARPLLHASRRHKQQGDWRQRCLSHACQPSAARPGPCYTHPGGISSRGLAPKVPVPCVSTFRGPARPLLHASRRHQQQGDWRQRCLSHARQSTESHQGATGGCFMGVRYSPQTARYARPARAAVFPACPPPSRHDRS